MTDLTLFTLGQAQAMLPGAVLIGDPAMPIARVHSDTRSLQAGDLFVALRGERFDAHEFLGKAQTAGAAAALAERGLAEAGLPGLQVADTQHALTTLATAWRRRYEGPLIAVAGSNGKTTVTQMVAAALRVAFGDAALATQGNFNNHIGLPLTILRLQPAGPQAHRAAVVELGMNHPGEIAQLAAVAQPTVAIVTNAQREHQEFMASVDAVARENAAVIDALPPSGVAVFPADDAFAPLWRGIAGAREVRTFGVGLGLGVQADVHADAQWQGEHWQVQGMAMGQPLAFTLRVAGLHNVKNALAAAAAALVAGAPIEAVQQGLSAFRPVKGRSMSRLLELAGREVVLVDDTYNANPDSVRAAIDVLAGLPQPGWLVLGDMGEVGDQGPAFHAEVGGYARERGIETLWTAGAMSEEAAHAFASGGGRSSRHFADVPALIAALDDASPCASVLVKGSRFMAMERVVQALDAKAAALQDASGGTDAA
jgi:UDP-N-acetylmuramoyl-tripeptide--D-alanyl-D-alanine ligase